MNGNECKSSQKNIKERSLKMKKIIDFLRDEEGAALPEYALLVALIAVVCIVAVTALGNRINVLFGQLVNLL